MTTHRGHERSLSSIRSTKKKQVSSLRSSASFVEGENNYVQLSVASNSAMICLLATTSKAIKKGPNNICFAYAKPGDKASGIS